MKTTEAPATARPLAVTGVAREGILSRYGLWLGAAVVLIVLPWVVRTGAAVPIMNQMGIAIVFALSFNMLLGQGGMLSFGHAVYFGLGGFIAAHALNIAGRGGLYLPVPLLPLVGGLGGLVFAALFGTFSTSRAGTVFSMVSLAVAELMAASSLIFDRFFGGEEGITTNRAKAPLLLGLEFTRDRQIYYLIAFWVFVAAVAMYAFSRTPIGRMANAVRDNPERAEFVGYSQRRVRYISFCAAGLFAGIAGGLFALNYEILTAENMGLTASGAVLLMTYIGGIGSFVGPVFGAIIFTFLQSMLSDYTGMWLLYVGILFLATVLWAPVGLAGVMMLHAPAWRAGRIGRLVGPYAVAGAFGLVAAVGIIGLLEMIHAVLIAESPTGIKRLFWTTVNVRAVLPWLVFAALVVAGALGLRGAGPRAATAFAEANRPGAPEAEGRNPLAVRPGSNR
ncbi:MAG TPA: branched-chain amino acid ABC transporter permease [Methylomirabilota bacterium]